MLLCAAGTVSTVRAQKVTLNFRDAKLEQVFGRITEQTGYTFYYARPTVNPDKVVSIAVADVDVRAALKQLLADDKVEIEIRDGKIYLSPPRQSTAVPQSVKGVVRDAAGQPVVGAAVIVKGTTRGVSSGTDGSFSFEGLADGAVLQVSALGYATAEIPVGNRSFVAVELKEDATLVDEVVVVGYGTQKKANLTGAVDQVSSELLENRPVANVTQMLQGAVPNLNISLADGKPNRSASYNIRGKTSIGAGGSALVLIDGVEGDPAMLNPNDIESVSVLKDAASAAIYGSRAPYGVVLITTKDPGKLTDKFTINYTGNVSIQQPTAIPDVVDDGYVYSRLFYDAWYNYRFNEPTGFNNSQDFSRAWLDTFRQRKLAGNKLETTVEPDGKYVYYGNTDYYDALYKDTVIAQTHNISVSGSNGKISHYLSGRLYDYNGLFNFTPDTYRTMNLRSKVSSQVFKWLKISNNFDYTHDRYRQPMGYSKEGGGVLWRSVNDQGHPSSPIFNPDGTLTKSGAYAEVKNHALSSRMEPGSTFKLAALLALVDDAGMSLDETFDTGNGARVKVGRTTVQDSHGLPPLNLKDAVAHSSNVFFARAVYETYKDDPERYVDYLRHLHLDRTVGLEEFGAVAPIFPAPGMKIWYPDVSIVNMGYGYAIELTPLHTLTLYNAVANDGCMVAPRLVREIRRGGEVVDTFYRLIRPRPNFYSHFTTAIHGLRYEDTADAPDFASVWREIEPRIEGLPLVAHNSPFDEGCLRAVFELYGMPWPGYTFYCTCRASRRTFGSRLPNHQLHTVSAACGFELENHHHALADAEACAQIALKIL